MHQTKKIGLIGGLSPESTVHYYQRICRGFNERTGGALRFPQLSLESLNLQEMMDLFERDDWEKVADRLRAAMDRLKAAGADFAAILANTPHNAWMHLEENTPLPVLTIMEATADALLKAECRKVALLGTRVSMEKGFFQAHFEKRGIKTVTPDEPDRKELDRVIWEELSHGIVNEDSRQRARSMLLELGIQGIEAVILGCTELSMLIQPEDTKLQLFDTMAIHADAILEKSLSD